MNNIQFVRVVVGAVGAFAIALAVFLSLALAYQWAYAKWVYPMKRVSVTIKAPDLLLRGVDGI